MLYLAQSIYLVIRIVQFSCQIFRGSSSGVARLFCSWAKFENYFSNGAAVFKITYNFFKPQTNLIFLMLIEKKYVQFLYKIVLTDLNCLLFKVTKKVQGPLTMSGLVYEEIYE